ncbi:hypothetical protein [Ensifer soli]|uniref:hypothetical protein n=1 Tax=Ciceribacter sp. sgz301302 TaxID=3342379 RepID=UPI0035BA9E59
MDENYPLVVTVWQFDRDVPVPDDYRENFDIVECRMRAQILSNQVRELVEDNDQKIEVSLTENIVELKSESGSSLDIVCYGPNVFDLTWWPSPMELESRGKLGFETASKLEIEIMRMLTYRYVTIGSLREQDA